MAQCKNREVQIRNCVPLHFFNYYMHISKMCAQAKKKNKDLNTQLSFNHDDVKVLIKTKGTAEPYRPVALE